METVEDPPMWTTLVPAHGTARSVYTPPGEFTVQRVTLDAPGIEAILVRSMKVEIDVPIGKNGCPAALLASASTRFGIAFGHRRVGPDAPIELELVNIGDEDVVVTAHALPPTQAKPVRVRASA